MWGKIALVMHYCYVFFFFLFLIPSILYITHIFCYPFQLLKGDWKKTLYNIHRSWTIWFKNLKPALNNSVYLKILYNKGVETTFMCIEMPYFTLNSWVCLLKLVVPTTLYENWLTFLYRSFSVMRDKVDKNIYFNLKHDWLSLWQAHFYQVFQIKCSGVRL